MGVFADSGANIGQWLLYLGQLRGVRALEFEPVTSQRQWLQECIEQQSDWSCRVFPCGLGSREEEKEIQCYGARSTFK